MANFIARRYSRQGLWSLFLMCALPLHAWTMILAFRDLSWLTDRTNAWDAAGVLCYGLVFALVESLVVFLLATLLGFLVSDRWEPDRRIAVLSLSVLVLSLWAMAGQLFFLLNGHVPDAILAFLVRAAHPYRVLLGSTLVIVTATFVVPILLVLRSKRALQLARATIERLSVLAIFYLVFDVAGIAVVLIRNI